VIRVGQRYTLREPTEEAGQWAEISIVGVHDGEYAVQAIGGGPVVAAAADSITETYVLAADAPEGGVELGRDALAAWVP
jgi:hypothetical protein